MGHSCLWQFLRDQVNRKVTKLSKQRKCLFQVTMNRHEHTWQWVSAGHCLGARADHFPAVLDWSLVSASFREPPPIGPGTGVAAFLHSNRHQLALFSNIIDHHDEMSKPLGVVPSTSCSSNEGGSSNQHLKALDVIQTDSRQKHPHAKTISPAPLDLAFFWDLQELLLVPLHSSSVSSGMIFWCICQNLQLDFFQTRLIYLWTRHGFLLSIISAFQQCCSLC